MKAIARPAHAIAIIPARGGSRRIPRKNLVPVLGTPMIGWVIRTALSANLFTRVIVSSEDNEVLHVAASFGAEAYKRPQSLADDFTHVGPVIDDCVRGLGVAAETICLLYATALLLRPEHLLEASRLLAAAEVESVLAIAEFESPIQRAYEIREDQSIAMVQPEFFSFRSQDLPPRYRDTGLFSWWKTRGEGGKRVGLLVPRSCAVDVDTPEDLEVARALFHYHRQPGSA